MQDWARAGAWWCVLWLPPVKGAGGIPEAGEALRSVRLWRALGRTARASGAEAVARFEG